MWLTIARTLENLNLQRNINIFQLLWVEKLIKLESVMKDNETKIVYKLKQISE